MMLKTWGMVPASVGSGRDAIAELHTAAAAGVRYELIICDLLMPGMDGFVLIQRLREEPELSLLKIMVLTSAGRRGDAARCQELGVGAYVTKPVRQSEFYDVITGLLSGREQEGAQPLITRYSMANARTASESLRVLVAEDNPVNQKLVTRLLEKRGHTVTAVPNGREAVNALERETYDLVLMDMQMPEMDGFEATSEIRKREKRRDCTFPSSRSRPMP